MVATTLTQLRTFALIARLGSLRAAAVELGVSEPAVSAAVAALRADLGDPLVVRSGGGIALTPGGRALAGHAREIVAAADRARREVAAAATAGDRLRVLATAACAEHVAGPLIDAFTLRSPGVEVDVATCPPGPTALAAALADGECDLGLGVRAARPADAATDCVPFLRYQRVLVAAPGHPLACAGPVDVTAARWLCGPTGLEPGSAEAQWLTGHPGFGRPEPVESEAAALAEVVTGEAVLLALAHVVRAELASGALVPLALPGTPVAGMWWASVPAQGRATPAAVALQRFLTTPAATTALVAGTGAAAAPGHDRPCASRSGADGDPQGRFSGRGRRAGAGGRRPGRTAGRRPATGPHPTRPTPGRGRARRVPRQQARHLDRPRRPAARAGTCRARPGAGGSARPPSPARPSRRLRPRRNRCARGPRMAGVCWS